jgi:hypothetical protein
LCLCCLSATIMFSSSGFLLHSIKFSASLSRIFLAHTSPTFCGGTSSAGSCRCPASRARGLLPVCAG